METKHCRKFTFLVLFHIALIFVNSYAQDTTNVKRSSRVKTIWDIPHKTFKEKWMWIHRSVAFNITKDRPANYDTAYIRSYKKRLVVTIPIAARFLKFTLIDIESKNKLAFTPNLEYNLGISLS